MKDKFIDIYDKYITESKYLKRNDAEKLISFVEKSIEEQTRHKHPFRDRLSHTYRVMGWVIKLWKKTGGDIEVLYTSVLFHDAGWSDDKPHALVSAKLAKGQLKKMGFDNKFINRVVNCVKKHSSKEFKADELNLEEKIIMDADLLDETGILGFVFDAMQAAIGDDPSYTKVLEISEKYIVIVTEQADFFKTDTGREIHSDNIIRYNKAIKWLRDELAL